MHSTAQASGRAAGNFAATSFGGGEGENRTQTFTAREEAVAHGPVNGGWANVFLGQKTMERAVDFFLARCEIPFQFHPSGTVELCGPGAMEKTGRAARARQMWAA